jgi:hypothetical protein
VSVIADKFVGMACKMRCLVSVDHIGEQLSRVPIKVSWRLQTSQLQFVPLLGLSRTMNASILGEPANACNTMLVKVENEVLRNSTLVSIAQ